MAGKCRLLEAPAHASGVVALDQSCTPDLSHQVPKAVMHFMVNNTKRGLQQHLIKQLYRDDVLEDLLSERPEVVMQRKVSLGAVRSFGALYDSYDMRDLTWSGDWRMPGALKEA